MTLEELKNYLKIDFPDDDMYLQSLIEVSEIYIDSCVGVAYKSDVKLLKLSKIAQCKLINDMYSNRGMSVEDNSKRDIIVTTILDKLSNVEVV